MPSALWPLLEICVISLHWKLLWDIECYCLIFFVFRGTVYRGVLVQIRSINLGHRDGTAVWDVCCVATPTLCLAGDLCHMLSSFLSPHVRCQSELSTLTKGQNNLWKNSSLLLEITWGCSELLLAAMHASNDANTYWWCHEIMMDYISMLGNAQS